MGTRVIHVSLRRKMELHQDGCIRANHTQSTRTTESGRITPSPPGRLNQGESHPVHQDGCIRANHTVHQDGCIIPSQLKRLYEGESHPVNQNGCIRVNHTQSTRTPLPPELCFWLSVNGFSHTSQTDISPLQSLTRLLHHHSSCTVCLRAQYWVPFSSSCTLRLSPIS